MLFIFLEPVKEWNMFCGSGYCFFFSAGSGSKDQKHPAPAPQPCLIIPGSNKVVYV